IGNIRYLRSRQMAAVNVYLRRRLPGLPADHINLLGSRYGMSFIDVAQQWDGYEGTALNIIASDFTPLEGLPPDTAVDALMTDLVRFVPDVKPADIREIVFQPHTEQPLFMNNAGGWAYRPDSRSGISNLYF